ncbi:AAA family ATPase [Nocardia caishijiensis]|uniref:Nuclease SbcCD subunit C n=1 Tax=Nocardia caishijiensis TaxID=184756 RepID=A0ABQ6YLC3_9NOCA|nr:AAA family ATPase [Nocardia caishijiensis]KAF0846241.1 AAA domain-containing protein [Nocardia caishijiensis]
MCSDRITEVVARELAADPAVEDRVADCVLAALTEVDDAVDTADAGDTGVFLRAVTVHGFRGIGPTATLRLNPGPGLSLVVGRNGSGKSSFAEAAEFALTGGNRRWDGRTSAWREGWRNLHEPDLARIEVELLTGGGEVTVATHWTPGAELAEAQWTERRGVASPAVIDPVSKRQGLDLYRPFLSYSELGALVDGKPSDLFDALHRLLGLDQLAAAAERIRLRKLELERAVKLSRQDRADLLDELTAVDDDRADRVAELLRESEPDLDAIAAEVAGSVLGAEGPDGLRAVLRVSLPDPAEVVAVADRLAAAAADLARHATTDAEADLRVLELLTRAREHVTAVGACPCPVCGRGDLGDDWLTATDAEITRRSADLDALCSARTEFESALAAARALPMPLPEEFADAPVVQISSTTRAFEPAATPSPLSDEAPWSGSTASGSSHDRPSAPKFEGTAAPTRPETLGERRDAVRRCWRAWASLATADYDEQLPDHLRTTYQDLAAELAALQRDARVELERLDAVWSPLVPRILAWLDPARAVAADAGELRLVRKAADWLKSATTTIRGERMRPLETTARWVWSTLRQQSNVELGAIRLQGSAGTARRVLLDVTVDEVDGAALGVMSQGELHALGLSLFLPRATVAHSPFRFVMIDDPVQAMDPAKVDGLARVLAEVALTRQVVVFTHDERLAEAVRRMQLDATVLEVQRRERSVVEVRVTGDPVRRYLDDARSLLRTPQLPPAIADELVATCCRSAIEAAGLAKARHELLAAGLAHAEVERRVRNAHTTRAMITLAIMGPRARVDDLNKHLSAVGGRWLVGVLRDATAGAHVPIDRPMRELISDTERFIAWLRAHEPAMARS